MKPHRRQFVIGPVPVAVHADWQSVPLDSGQVLTHCPTLPVATARDVTGTLWHLLGLTYQAGPELPSPIEHIALTGTEAIQEAYRSWLGRWILVGNGELHMDAAGTLGCFYRTVHGRSSSEVWASSSGAILARHIPRRAATVAAPGIAHGRGMDWYPPPRSRFAGISRLLVSQVLQLQGSARVRWRPLVPEHQTKRDYETTLAFLEQTLTTGLKDVARRHEEVWLPLTGGLDSRLLLAAVHAAGITVQTFTQLRQPPTMPVGDRDLPPRLAGRMGYPHRMIPPAQGRSRDLAVFDEHTGGHSVDQDRRFYARGQWADVPSTAAVLRAGAFEIGRADLYDRFPDGDPDDIGAALAHEYRFRDFHRASFPHADGVAAWLDWVHAHPEDVLDWRDRLYFEQRVAGWLSATEQALDLLGPHMLNPAVCQQFLSASLSLPVAIRRRSQHHVDLIRRMAPELLELPVNPPEPYVQQKMRLIHVRARNARGRLRSLAAEAATR